MTVPQRHISWHGFLDWIHHQMIPVLPGRAALPPRRLALLFEVKLQDLQICKICKPKKSQPSIEACEVFDANHSRKRQKQWKFHRFLR